MYNRFIRPKSQKDQLYDFMLKLIIIGDSGVGKTNILTRFCQDQFKDSHVATIGVDFNVKTIQIQDKKFKLQIWDTAGQQRFKTITQTYYRGAAGIILCYSVDSQDSFQSVEKWIAQVNSKVQSSVRKILVANKCDIQERIVSRKQGQQMAKKYNLLYIQTSAKNNKGVEQVFYAMTRQLKQKMQEQGGKMNLTKTITLNSSQFVQKEGVKGLMTQDGNQQQNGRIKNLYNKCSC